MKLRAPDAINPPTPKKVKKIKKVVEMRLLKKKERYLTGIKPPAARNLQTLVKMKLWELRETRLLHSGFLIIRIEG